MQKTAKGKGKLLLTLLLGVLMILLSTLLVNVLLSDAMGSEWSPPVTPGPTFSGPADGDNPPFPTGRPGAEMSKEQQALEDYYRQLMAVSQSREWTLSEKARLDELRLAAGVTIVDSFLNGVPGPDDLTEEQAVSAATEAIRQKYAIKAEALDKYTPSVAFNIADPQQPVWQVSFSVRDPGEFQLLGDYTVQLDARTGEIQKIDSGAPANG